MATHNRRITRIVVEIVTKLDVSGNPQLPVAQQHDFQMIAVIHPRPQSLFNVFLNPKPLDISLTETLQATMALKMTHKGYQGCRHR